MIEITFLVDHPEAIPTLTHWFRAQWPEYYAERTPADIAQGFCSEANRDGYGAWHPGASGVEAGPDGLA